VQAFDLARHYEQRGAQAGRPEQARTALSTAIALYRDRGVTFWLPKAEAALEQAR
jgi:hypothetical protein